MKIDLIRIKLPRMTRGQLSKRLRKKYPNFHIVSVRQVQNFYDLPLEERKKENLKMWVYIIPNVLEVIEEFENVFKE